jgi:hypothetical protein
MREQADVGILDDILRLRVITQDTACQTIEPPIVRLDDGTDGDFIVVLYSLDQSLLVGARGGGCRGLRWFGLA